MKVIKFLSGLIIKIVVAIMILALILVIASIFITPATIGIENVEINGVSLEDQGLADVSFYNIGKILLGILSTTEEEQVGDETYVVVIDKLPTVSDTEEEKDESLTRLLDEPLVFEESVEITMDSDELSALMNMVFGTKTMSDLNTYFAGSLDGATFLSSGEIILLDQKVNLTDADEYLEMTEEELFEFMKEYDSQYISIVPSTDGTYIYLTTKVQLSLPEDIVEEINAMNVLTISNVVYFTFDSVYTLEDGALVPVKATENTMCFNSLSAANTIPIASSLLSLATGESVDGEAFLISYNNTSSSMVARILNNLGDVKIVEGETITIQTRTE